MTAIVIYMLLIIGLPDGTAVRVLGKAHQSSVRKLMSGPCFVTKLAV